MATVVQAFQQAQPEGIALIQLAYLAWLESQDNEQFASYVKHREYYAGDHATCLTKRQRAYLNVANDAEFNLNACPIVVNCLAEALKVEGFTTGTDEKQPEKFAEWWQQNRMDGQQGVVHLAAVRDGDTYVLVEWDNGKGIPLFTAEMAYDGSEGMHIVYSDERRRLPLLAVKRWTITSGVNVKTRRTNIYYANRIEKYSDMGTGQAWQQFYEDGSDVWPIPWTEDGLEGGVPLGLPVFHFRNQDQGASYGVSELDNVTPPQDALNKTVSDLLGAADTTGFQMFYGTGLPDTLAPITVAPGMFLKSSDANAKFGAIPAGDLSGLMALKDSWFADIAKITRTPTSFFQLTGAIAAAGTLKEQRSGLDAKAEDRQVTFGNAWEDVMAFARHIANVFGSAGMDETLLVSTAWTDVEEPTDLERAEEAELMNRAGAASTKTKVKVLHPTWSAEEIDEEVDLIQAETGAAVPDIGAPPPEGMTLPPPPTVRETKFVKDASGAIVGKIETQTGA
jgi:Phage portal protein, SPP1 Gp6-like